MALRPSELAERISDQCDPGDEFLRETFRLPVEAARAKAREIISQNPHAGYVAAIERWRQLADGQIEFTMRRLRTAD